MRIEKENFLTPLKKVFVAMLVLVYPVVLQGEDVLSARASSRGGRGSFKSSKKSSRKNTRGKISVGGKRSGVNSFAITKEADDDDHETSAVATTTATTASSVSEVSATATNTAVATTTTAEATGEVEKEATPTSGTVPDMSKDAQWEDFRICMQQNCVGGDEQPSNVECYKAVNFDNAFNSCKSMVDSSKWGNYRNYFTGPFIRKEKAEFCKGEIWYGKFDETTGKCVLNVQYTRARVSNECLSDCGAVSKSKNWYVDGRTYICSGDNFGVGECHRDGPNCSASKIQKATGMVSLAGGAIMGGVAAWQAVKDTKATVSRKETKTVTQKDEDGNVLKDDKGNALTETVTTYEDVQKNSFKNMSEEERKSYGIGEKELEARQRELNRDKAISGTLSGLQASSSFVTSGVTAIATANIYKEEKGDRVYGVCTLPNGQIVSEGNSIKLSW